MLPQCRICILYDCLVNNGLVGAYEVVPYAINKHGDIAGLMHETSASPGAAFVLIDDKPYKIAEGAEQGIVLSINDHRQAVGGYAFRGQGDRTRAFLWEKGELIDLSGLEEVQQAGWAGLHGAAAINNDGIIVGNGTKLNGNTHAFMLVPKKLKL